MSIAQPLIHPRNKASLQNQITTPHQVTMLVGEKGSNVSEIARWFGVELSKQHSIKPENIITIERQPKDSSIGLEAIQLTLNKVKYKNTSDAGSLVHIYEADLLTTEAQNRLLKTLEEPNSNLYFVLSTSHAASILPTIRSRVSSLQLLNPSKEQINASYSNKHSSEEIQKAFVLSRGAILSLEAILRNEEDQAITIGKTLLGSKQFERLTYIDQLTKDRELAKGVITILIRIFDTLLHQSAQKDDREKVALYTKSLELCIESFDVLERNGNTKIVLTRLFLNM